MLVAKVGQAAAIEDAPALMLKPRAEEALRFGQGISGSAGDKLDHRQRACSAKVTRTFAGFGIELLSAGVFEAKF